MPRNTENKIDPDKLGKIVRLAKDGHGSERAAAIQILHRLCLKYGLIFDEIMSEDLSRREFSIVTTLADFDILKQVIARYGLDEESEGNLGSVYKSRAHARIHFMTTQERYIETLNAFDVLRKLYRKEKKITAEAVFYGFLTKHDLYYKHPKGPAGKWDELPEEERKARTRGTALAREMEDAELQRRLDTKK